MTLQETIKDDMVKAMKAKEPFKVGILRVVMTDFSRVKTGSDKKITDDEALKCIKLGLKRAADTLKLLPGDLDSEKEIEILSGYMPAMLTEEHIEVIVDGIIKARGFNSMRDMGKVMGEIKKHPDAARIDGTLSSTIVKRLLK